MSFEEGLFDRIRPFSAPETDVIILFIDKAYGVYTDPSGYYFVSLSDKEDGPFDQDYNAFKNRFDPNNMPNIFIVGYYNLTPYSMIYLLAHEYEANNSPYFFDIYFKGPSRPVSTNYVISRIYYKFGAYIGPTTRVATIYSSNAWPSGALDGPVQNRTAISYAVPANQAIIDAGITLVNPTPDIRSDKRWLLWAIDAANMLGI